MITPDGEKCYGRHHADGLEVLFFKVKSPVEPVRLVHRICSDAQQTAHAQRSRYIQRLTPMTKASKATLTGLEEISETVLAPHFLDESRGPTKV